MSFPGAFGPGMMRDIIKYESFMHFQGGRLYDTRKTGHVLWDTFIFENVLKPSVTSPRRTLQLSLENH